MSEGADNRTNDPVVAGLRRLVYVNLVGLFVITALLSLPWLGVGYCVFVGSSWCPAILSPRMAPSAEPIQTPRATDTADRLSAAPLLAQSAGNLPTANPKYVALVIGNTNYTGANKLKNPGPDAVAIAETLKTLNYTIVGGKAQLDLTLAQMFDVLKDFKVRAANATVAVVYYAGHGIQIDELEPIYLIPVDAKLQRKAELEFEAVRLSQLTAILPVGRDQYGLVILDACRTSNYPLEGLEAAKRGAGQRGLKAVTAPNRAFVAFSASAGEPASDGEGANSPYATALLKRMKDKDAPDIKAVFARVQDDFRESGLDQSPGHDDRLGDRKIRLAASAAPSPVGTKKRDCDVCPEVVVLPKGTFLMGAPKSEEGSTDEERPQHQVTVESFAIGTHEVTFREWDACVADGGCTNKADDQGSGRGDRPVINVNWDDAQEYVRWLSARTYNSYRLPTEAEWEYAARAGSKTAYPWGDKASKELANYGGVGGRDKWIETAPVGQFPPNKFGLFDMHGNVWEWLEDCWNESYKLAPSDGRAWTTGDCTRRVLRSGSWSLNPQVLRSASRYGDSFPAYRLNDIGFRVARTL